MLMLTIGLVARANATATVSKRSTGTTSPTIPCVGYFEIGRASARGLDALVGARSNLELKLSSLTDEAYAKAVVQEIARLSGEGTTAANAAESWMRVPPA